MIGKKHRRDVESHGYAWAHWLFLGLTVVLLGLVAKFVDLKPHIDENFFFSSHDPIAQESDKIDRMFGGDSQLILAVEAPDITAPSYLERLDRMTEQLDSIPSVDSVDSLADGPKNVKDAEKSPFWTRLLIAENGRSSNVVMFVSSRDPQELIERIEAVVAKFNANDFRIEIAGAPYVSEMIRRKLLHDFQVFSLTAFLLFGAVMLVLFRSLKLTLGMLVTCTNAVLGTLLIQAAFGEKIGVLTANLGTIVFVIALSHLVYMTFNWQTLSRGHADSGHLGIAGAADNVASIVLVNGVCFTGIREPSDRAGEAFERAGCRRNVGGRRGIRVCLPDVSSVSGLGWRGAEESAAERKGGPFLAGKIRVGVRDYNSGERWVELGNVEIEY